MVYSNTGWSGPSPVRVVETIKGRLDYEMNQDRPVLRLAPTPLHFFNTEEEVENLVEAVRRRASAH